MLGIDPTVATHRLNVNSDTRFVRQRKRQLVPERQKVIQEEIAKLVNA